MQAYPSGGTSSNPRGSYLIDTAWLDDGADPPTQASDSGFPDSNALTAISFAERRDPFRDAGLGSLVAAKRSESQVRKLTGSSACSVLTPHLITSCRAYCQAGNCIEAKIGLDHYLPLPQHVSALR